MFRLSSWLLPSLHRIATTTFTPLRMYRGFSIHSCCVQARGICASGRRWYARLSSTSCGSPIAALPIAHWYVFRGAWLWWLNGIRPVVSECTDAGCSS